MKSHVERRCSNLGPTQSRITEYALVYEDNTLAVIARSQSLTPCPFVCRFSISWDRRRLVLWEQLLHINVQRFRSGRVFLYHSTLGLRVIKKKKK